MKTIQPTLDDELEMLEAKKQQATEAVELALALERLESNPDWKKVIEEVYQKDNACRLVEQKAMPACQDEELQKAIMKNIDGIGSFTQFLRAITLNGMQAQQTLDEHAELLAEVYAAHELVEE